MEANTLFTADLGELLAATASRAVPAPVSFIIVLIVAVKVVSRALALAFGPFLSELLRGIIVVLGGRSVVVQWRFRRTRSRTT